MWKEIHLRSREFSHSVYFEIGHMWHEWPWDGVRVRRLIIEPIIARFARPPHASSFPSFLLISRWLSRRRRQHVDSSSSLRRIFLPSFCNPVYYPGRTIEAKYKLTQDVLHPTCVLLGKIEGIWEMDEEVTSGIRVSRETVGVETAS